MAMMVLLTWSGVQSGWRSSIRAATPETTGAAIEVPPARMYWPSTTHVGQRLVKALSGASVETMWAPGAPMSGFSKPSCVAPTLDHSVGASSPRHAVPLSSIAPTVSANGSLPGA